jgi:hypothetical protein
MSEKPLTLIRISAPGFVAGAEIDLETDTIVRIAPLLRWHLRRRGLWVPESLGRARVSGLRQLVRATKWKAEVVP